MAEEFLKCHIATVLFLLYNVRKGRMLCKIPSVVYRMIQTI